jgi:pyridoxamine 5'-phosphate oxidase
MGRRKNAKNQRKRSVTMTKAEILAFINANRDCHMATVDGNQPRVRAMGMVKADENGIIMEVGVYKDVYKQLLANPNVELCFNNFKQGIQVRVRGTVEPVDDNKLKDEIIAMRPFLKPRFEKDGYGAIGVFRVKGKAHVWTMETNFEPKKYVQI